jgi:hypothetical protein
MTSTNAQIHMANDNGEEVTSGYTPVKTSAWDSFKGFWMTHHNLRRYPFYPPGEPKRTGTSSFWSDLKEFFQTRQKFGRRPFE